MDGAALRIRLKWIARRTHHELTLVGLAHIHVHPAGDHDAAEHRFDDVGDESLKRIALNGNVETAHGGEKRRPSRADESHLFRANGSTHCPHTCDAVATNVESRDLTP